MEFAKNSFFYSLSLFVILLKECNLYFAQLSRLLVIDSLSVLMTLVDSFSGRYCGDGKLPDTLITSGYRMLVTYKSSPNQHRHRGFKANYEGIGFWP